jgi:hypothetical protein
MSDEMSVRARCYSLTLTPHPIYGPRASLPSCSINLPRADLACPQSRNCGNPTFCAFAKPHRSSSKMRQERVFSSDAVPGGPLILDSPPIKGARFHPLKMLHSAVRSSFSVSHQYATGDQAYQSREANPRRQANLLLQYGPFDFQGRLLPRSARPCFIVLFFSFVYCFVSCLHPWFIICPP